MIPPPPPPPLPPPIILLEETKGNNTKVSYDNVFDYSSVVWVLPC